jgi:adenylate cyclase
MSVSYSLNLFRATVANLLKVARVEVLPDGTRQSVLDFQYRDKNDARVMVAARFYPVGDKTLKKERARIEQHAPDYPERFLLVTPHEPSTKQIQDLRACLAKLPFPADWLSLAQFARVLGMTKVPDFLSAAALSKLQAAATTIRFEKYAGAPVGPDVPGKAAPRAGAKPTTGVPLGFEDLARQFSLKTAVKLQQSISEERPIEEGLAIGREYQNAIVVLSDLKNFSTIVKAVPAEALRDEMTAYYAAARRLVWEHGGVLDKFIGDAVLAIFNYPQTSPNAAFEAVRFAAELVALGQQTTGRLSQVTNEVIASGTRVGIASGPLWPLDIGSDRLEVSFVGDVINLAARLEKACPVNSVLLANTTRSLLAKVGAGPVQRLALKSFVIQQQDAKGQSNDIQTWEVEPAILEKLVPPPASA